jgi:hypothetical protein
MNPTVLYPMVVSSHRLHADRHLSIEAERRASGAADIAGATQERTLLAVACRPWFGA